MAIALNVFRTITANLTTSGNVVYSAPIGYSTVVLLAQVSNIGVDTITVTADHVRSGSHTTIIKDASLPISDSMNLLFGKLILQTGDGFSAYVSDNDSAQLILSLLETANP